jgi:hypothetical protein
MTFSSFSFSVGAAPLTNAEKVAKVLDLGVIVGEGDGVNLEQNLTRYRAFTMLVRLTGNQDELDNFTYDANSATFADANAEGVSPFVQKLMAYLKANQDVYGIVGYEDGTLRPYEEISSKEYTRVLLEALGYRAGVDYDWNTVELLSTTLGLGDSTTINDNLVNVENIALLTFNTLATVSKGSEETLGKRLGFNVVPDKVAVALSNVAATGAKLLTVNFNQAVNADDATITVKRGTVTSNISKVTFAEDNKSAVIELSAKLTEGNYTVNVAGLTDEALTSTISVENEKVTDIELSETAPLSRSGAQTIVANFKVLNQYGEDITRSSSISFTATRGSQNISYVNGTLSLTDSNVNFKENDKVTVTALHIPTGTFNSAVVNVVAQAKVADIEIVSLYHENDKEIDVNSNVSEYRFIVEAKDQYGNDVPHNEIAHDIIVTASNPTHLDVAGGHSSPTFTRTNIDGVERTTLALANGGHAGTFTFSMISTFNGDRSTYTVTVKEAGKVDNFEISAPEFAVAGERIEIPYLAYDQYGVAITDVDVLNAMTLNVSNGSIYFEKDYVNNTVKLFFDATGLSVNQPVMITGLTDTYKAIQLNISLLEKAEPTIIEGLKDVTLSLAKTATVELDDEDVIIKDQYGRTMDLPAGYVINVTSNQESRISLSASSITTSSAVTFEGLTKGTSIITFTLNDGTDNVEGSEYTVTARVVEKADIVSYEVADFAKLYQNTTTHPNHAVKLTVRGILADGTKVVVPQSGYYNVIVNDNYVDFVGGKLTATAGYNWKDDQSSREVNVVVAVDAKDGMVVLENKVTVYKSAPKIASLELVTNGVATKEENGLISVAAVNAQNISDVEAFAVDAIKAVDQYGKEFTDSVSDYTFFVTNISNDRTVDSLVAGTTFSVTAISNDGPILTFNAIVK